MINQLLYQLLNVHIVVDIDFSDVIKRKKEENKRKKKSTQPIDN